MLTLDAAGPHDSQAVSEPWDEGHRLEVLRSYHILDTCAEKPFDDIVRLASRLFDVPIALISLVDDDRQWFKARVGLDACETGRDVAFCAHAIRGDDVMIVLDARLDPRFAENPLVTGAAGIRFYAGAPLAAPCGAKLGTLCVIDTKPRATPSPELVRLLADMAGLIMDKLERRRAEVARQRSEERFRALAEATFEAILLHDGGRIVDANAVAAELLGVPLARLIGSDLIAFLPAASLEPGGPGTPGGDAAETVLRRGDSCELAVELRRSRVSRAGEPMGVIALRDLTQRKQAEAEIRRLAYYDALTGLPNRALLHDRLHEAVARARRDGTGCAVLCLDLNRFKLVNDTLGHAAGDRVLRETARRLLAATRDTDTVARLGGDEFAVLLNHASSANAAMLSARLLASLRQPIVAEGMQTYVEASLGIAMVSAQSEEPERILRDADIALYRAKAEGRGGFRFYAPEMDRELQRRQALEHGLRQALARDEFELFYQGRFNTATLTLAGVEALIRWRHPERGLVPPGEFISIAEETGLIVPIGAWVLRTACAAATAWDEIKVSVNLSPVQFRRGDLAGTVEAILKETGLAPARLELEITEGVLLEDTAQALQVLKQLRELGVGLALDDFGTGYSSLSYLQRFAFDRIKVDQSFVQRLGSSEDAASIVRAVLGLGLGLGMGVTAEGVESHEQLDFLRAEGCEEVQGFHLARPVPLAAMSEMIAGQRRHPVAPAAIIPATCLGDHPRLRSERACA